MINRPSPNRVAFGRLIRAYREAARLTQIQMAEMIFLSDSWISGVETGQVMPTIEQTERIEGCLGIAAGTFTDVRNRAVNESHPVGSFEAFTDLEDKATTIHLYEPLVITGLLQTADYARALIRGGRPTAKAEAIGDLVDARLRRQAILARDDAPTLWVVMDEVVLHRTVGGLDTHLAQLDALIEAAQLPNVTVQLLPSDIGEHAGLASNYMIFRFDEAPDVGYTEDQLAGHPYKSPEAVRALWEGWGALQAATLSAAASLKVIRKIREEMANEHRQRRVEKE